MLTPIVPKPEPRPATIHVLNQGLPPFISEGDAA